MELCPLEFPTLRSDTEAHWFDIGDEALWFDIGDEAKVRKRNFQAALNVEIDQFYENRNRSWMLVEMSLVVYMLLALY